jgi:transcriptional regulator with GAF, ATPase, and Fis domain
MIKISSIGFHITVTYVVVSVLWILSSDYLVYSLFSDSAIATNIEIVKGWFFVAITAALLYKMIAKNTDLLLDSERKVQAKHEETMVVYEELIAAEEELKQQFEELLDREGKINRRNECLNTLHEVALIFMQGNIVEDLLETVVNKMKAMSGAQYGYIYLLDENNGMLMKASVNQGFPIDKIKTSIKKGDGIIGRVWESGETLVVYNYHKWQGRLREPIYSSIQTGVGLPLKAGEKIIGVFSMNYTIDHVVDTEELKILESFAELASMALGNKLLQGALQESQHHNQALSKALKARDFVTDGHADRLQS